MRYRWLSVHLPPENRVQHLQHLPQTAALADLNGLTEDVLSAVCSPARLRASAIGEEGVIG